MIKRVYEIWCYKSPNTNASPEHEVEITRKREALKEAAELAKKYPYVEVILEVYELDKRGNRDYDEQASEFIASFTNGNKS